MSEARTDALTGLPNRRAFDEDLTRRLAEHRRYRRPVVGHDGGHRPLQEIQRYVRASGRATRCCGRWPHCCDKPCASRIWSVRFGGEEMAVVMPGTSIAEACLGARRARQAIESARFPVDGQQLNVTVSVGTAECVTRMARKARETRPMKPFMRPSRRAAIAPFGTTGNAVWPVDGEAARLPRGTQASDTKTAASYARRGQRGGGQCLVRPRLSGPAQPTGDGRDQN